MTVNRPLILAACLSGALAVALGAFAAHGAGPAIKTLLTTGGHYLIVHALLALACGVWPLRDRRVGLAGWLAVAGGLVFCLSLAAIGWTGSNALGAVTPIGGLLMIASWLLLGFAAFGNTKDAV